MKFIAEINVMPHKEILDPQGKAVTKSMVNLGLNEIQNVRIGKHITLEIESPDQESARAKVDEACRKLLANLIMESYDFTLRQA
ncbi:phosphoribosylformylglycinamidine synthase [Anseongella ginsenosidimutans]|uniref:Phosphoribosylformylglycinamidine synthase subunit PurS n=1 Tax=Anseongella ginsenosidimutans TaxID=496056 RepID=A0A4R3KNV1_9SPHI|nr:phosphoribosylformylglycinamidine synthase subunit PurS [Anseongella ginsenosidimutans]QEC53705.1 phosphoribosylformylglycinamidine synthase subunit PurS [Anseongella ginsenosidimutans]TCS86044.1 phosphoribosylformylglycinamidine synthase [Anseongella ginsenosidimutans]